MFALSDVILIVFAIVFASGILTLDFSVFETWQRALAEKVADRCGLYNIYFQLSAAQDLEMIRSLRHYETAYWESVVDVVAETLSIPEMLLILGVSRVREALNRPVSFPNLTDQALMTAHFYIDVAKHRLWQTSSPSGPHAQRLCSRWRRRSS